MKKNILGVFIFFLFSLLSVNAAWATGYCPNYSSSKGNSQCYCYPVWVTATNNTNSCSNGHATSVTIHWDAANCNYCQFIIHYTDSSTSKTKTVSNGCTNFSNSSATITGTNITGKVGVGPYGSQSSQITYDTPAVCPVAPTPTPTHGPTPTPTHGPTPTPQSGPTATPTPGPGTLLNLPLKLPGIGNGGNLSPKHNTRQLHISIYASDADPKQPNVSPVFDSKTLTVTYNSTTGYFTNPAINLGNLATGDYQLLVKVPGYLRKQYADSSSSTKTITITKGTTTLAPVITLTVVDVGPLFNVVDASDFYNIVGCYKDKANGSSCAVGSQTADLNDDGTVDGIDLNYWLLGFQSLINNNDTDGTGDGITGD